MVALTDEIPEGSTDDLAAAIAGEPSLYQMVLQGHVEGLKPGLVISLAGGIIFAIIGRPWLALANTLTSPHLSRRRERRRRRILSSSPRLREEVRVRGRVAKRRGKAAGVHPAPFATVISSGSAG